MFVVVVVGYWLVFLSIDKNNNTDNNSNSIIIIIINNNNNKIDALFLAQKYYNHISVYI